MLNTLCQLLLRYVMIRSQNVIIVFFNLKKTLYLPNPIIFECNCNKNLHFHTSSFTKISKNHIINILHHFNWDNCSIITYLYFFTDRYLIHLSTSSHLISYSGISHIINIIIIIATRKHFYKISHILLTKRSDRCNDQDSFEYKSNLRSWSYLIYNNLGYCSLFFNKKEMNDDHKALRYATRQHNV